MRYGHTFSYAGTAQCFTFIQGLQDKALALAKQANDRETALRAALGFEKDTLLFFYDLREMVSKADRESISNVIREEKKHVRRLAGML